jgi:hypothetical protein
MSFFCLFLFFGLAGERGVVCCSWSPNLLSLPPLSSLNGTIAPIFRRWLFEFYFRYDTLTGIRSARSGQTPLKKLESTLRPLSLRATNNRGLKQLLFSHAFFVTSGGHHYAG